MRIWLSLSLWVQEGRTRGRVGWRCVLQEDVAHLNLPMELTNLWVLGNHLIYQPYISNIGDWEYSRQCGRIIFICV